MQRGFSEAPRLLTRSEQDRQLNQLTFPHRSEMDKTIGDNILKTLRAQYPEAFLVVSDDEIAEYIPSERGFEE
jgi:hypothetical protein